MAGFRAAAEEFERVHGKMSNDELRQFKAEWKKANGVSSPEAKPAESPRAAYVREAYTDAGKKVTGTARTIKDLLMGAFDVGPAGEEKAAKSEEGIHKLGDWLSKVGERMAPDDAHERNRKEQILERAVEHMGNKLNELLTGESRVEHLRPEYGGDEPFTETTDFNFPGREGSPDNPIKLHATPLSMPSNKEQGIEEMPEEVGKVRFRKGSRENPIRLDPINLPESPELRTEEVTINVPKRVAKR